MRLGHGCKEIHELRQNNQAERISAERPCQLCGRPRGYMHLGRWCWRCYTDLIGDDRRSSVPVDYDREQRIERYAARAAQGLPLFESEEV